MSEQFRDHVVGAKNKATYLFNRIRGVVEDMRMPLYPPSFDEFMGLVGTDGTIVRVYPEVSMAGYSYSREKKPHEYIGGLDPGWVNEFCHTGYQFSTSWQSRTPHNRLVVFREVHAVTERFDSSGRSNDSRVYREKWMRKTLEDAKNHHQQFPNTKFMMDGPDGLQEYTYYLNRK